MNAPTYVGIDNGINGGLAIIGPVRGAPPVAVLRMPVKAGQVDVLAVLEWLEAHVTPAVIGVESPCHVMKQIQSMRSLAINYGLLLGCLRIRYRNFPTKIVEVDAHSSTSWQKVILGKVPKGETKAYALAAAKCIWPDESFIPSGCRTPHDGIIDAVLIAEFLRRRAKP